MKRKKGAVAKYLNLYKANKLCFKIRNQEKVSCFKMGIRGKSKTY